MIHYTNSQLCFISLILVGPKSPVCCHMNPDQTKGYVLSGFILLVSKTGYLRLANVRADVTSAVCLMLFLLSKYSDIRSSFPLHNSFIVSVITGYYALDDYTYVAVTTYTKSPNHNKELMNNITSSTPNC